MAATLNEINGVVGVTGSFVCSNDGTVVAHALPAQFDSARVASQTFLALETSGHRVAEADLLFAQGRLILKNLRGGILAILCTRNINVPLLNLTANLAAKKFATELNPPKARTHEPAAAPVLAPKVDVSQVRAKERVAASVPEIKQEMRPMAEGSAPSSSPPPPEFMDAKFFDQLTRELARAIGPAASILVEEGLGALKETRETFPKARAAELVGLVERGIRDETKRARFQQVMAEVIRK